MRRVIRKMKIIDIVRLLFPYYGIKKQALEIYFAEIDKTTMTAEEKFIKKIEAIEKAKKTV